MISFQLKVSDSLILNLLTFLGVLWCFDFVTPKSAWGSDRSAEITSNPRADLRLQDVYGCNNCRAVNPFPWHHWSSLCFSAEMTSYRIWTFLHASVFCLILNAIALSFDKRSRRFHSKQSREKLKWDETSDVGKLWSVISQHVNLVFCFSFFN